MKRTWSIPRFSTTCVLVVLIVIFIKNGETLTKSVRHGRHRRVSGPDPVVLNSNGRMVKEEQKENKHKPNFERCDDYTPEVLEEEPVGKFSSLYNISIPKHSDHADSLVTYVRLGFVKFAINCYYIVFYSFRCFSVEFLITIISPEVPYITVKNSL